MVKTTPNGGFGFILKNITLLRFVIRQKRFVTGKKSFTVSRTTSISLEPSIVSSILARKIKPSPLRLLFAFLNEFSRNHLIKVTTDANVVPIYT